jgi:nucleoside-triphosphatase THEP1
MELFSPHFREAVLKAITCGKKVLGTIMLNTHPFADEIKKQLDIEVIQVTTANRDLLRSELIAWLKSNSNEDNA